VAKAAPAAAVELIEGPLTDFEKAEIERLGALGKTSKQIGDTLRRKSQTVGLYLNNKARAAERAAEAETPAAPRVTATPPVAAKEVVTQSPPQVPPSEWGFAERRIVAHLNGLPRAMDWDLGSDLSMCQALARGDKLAMVAIDMGKDAQWIKQRHATVTATIRNGMGQITVDGGAMLLRVMSSLVANAQKGAA
jgi:hypothetical protein